MLIQSLALSWQSFICPAVRDVGDMGGAVLEDDARELEWQAVTVSDSSSGSATMSAVLRWLMKAMLCGNLDFTSTYPGNP